MDEAIDHQEQGGRGPNSQLSAWLWKPWYAKLWWATIPVWWIGMAVSMRVDPLARPIHETEVPGLLGGDAFSVM